MNQLDYQTRRYRKIMNNQHILDVNPQDRVAKSSCTGFHRIGLIESMRTRNDADGEQMVSILLNCSTKTTKGNRSYEH
jgi:hypothetical protein